MFGCLISIVLWKVDRSYFFKGIDRFLVRIVKKIHIAEYTYLFGLVILIFIHIRAPEEIYDLLTLLIVIDISNAERKNVMEKDTHFYASISTISRAVVTGFIAPLFYIIILGNKAAIVYFLIANIWESNDYKILRSLYNIMTIIPAMLTQPFLYSVYIFRNKIIKIDFKGDYTLNCVIRPLLNIDIFGAYIEKVNFYYYFSLEGINYIKNYGQYENKIEISCIKDYLSIAYCICILAFAVFYMITVNN
ncbi:hypothetical protein IAI10_08185 [Clostridium sp. 19966]|uniref:hypothetical protein n=1 Tax=Clostridium sp. 19966 TaxID=2768166 RepID=UPI0028DF6C9B|nr:hypothetical protein [Clostridium sp. 19966]MDT8716633.1 hypothetical protein [Clostridium sp. 19966]